ncbi:hypothetical protein [Dactylosporangium matsuzakiense]|uniref:Uncharacterized protein n=1 Tax=Dactylosporangium matsuzakiense TaxID=53360 RepID=A0A9W6KPD8_9ACTN|nr:hypothetical protein [Dactylosporangium matsuzakiense]GLL05123.1 hypothetical protein GCM10017581_068700 [Dactylosporangium matsuzakiense]
MWSTILTAILIAWNHLPQITIVLKFCTALMGLVVTAPLLVRRVRRWLRRRRTG